MTSQTAPEIDTLGATGRAQIVARMLATIQSQRFELDIMQVANAADEDDPLPGSEGQTYGTRRADLDDSERRIHDAYASLMPEVKTLIGGRPS